MTTEVFIREGVRDGFEADCKNPRMGFAFVDEVPLLGFSLHGMKLLRYQIWSLTVVPWTFESTGTADIIRE